MTRYRILSDLHSELWPENPVKARRVLDRLLPPLPTDGETVLLLPGDTGSHRRRRLYAAVVRYLCKRFCRVLDIPGNHFWYGGSDWCQVEPPVACSNYQFGLTFTSESIAAATLFADFQRDNPLVMEQCRRSINDFKTIPGLTPAKVGERHRAHVAFLRASISRGGIVMTHFAPSWQSVPPQFKADPLSGYYASALDALIETHQPAIWVHGHIHDACDYRIGDTRVLSNPAGYYGTDHNPALLVDA